MAENIVKHEDLLSFSVNRHDLQSEKAGEDIFHFEIIDSKGENFYHFMLNKAQLERLRGVLKEALGDENNGCVVSSCPDYNDGLNEV